MFITSMRGNERIVALRQIRGGGVPTTVYYIHTMSLCSATSTLVVFLLANLPRKMGHRDGRQGRKREMCTDLHFYRLLLVDQLRLASLSLK